MWRCSSSMVLTQGQGIQTSFSLAQDMRCVSQLRRVVIQVTASLSMDVLDKGLTKASLCGPWVWTGLLDTLCLERSSEIGKRHSEGSRLEYVGGRH